MEVMYTGKNFPSLSVLMPVYNAERYVGEAVESILNQTYRDFEFVILDDGSTDGSLALLRGYEQQDPRIRLYTRENRGLVATLNEGIGYCRAPLIARMDADDISLPERFEKQVEYMKAHPEVVACGSFAQQILPSGAILDDMTFPQDQEGIYNSLLFFRGPWLLHPSAILRTEVVRAIGGYNSEFTYAEDNDFFLRMGEAGALANVPDCLYLYRQHTTNTCYTAGGKQAHAGWRAAVAACQRQGIPLPASLESEPDVARVPVCTSEIYKRWAWKLLSRGSVAHARRYAMRAALARPWSPEIWRLVACVVRGH